MVTSDDHTNNQSHNNNHKQTTTMITVKTTSAATTITTNNTTTNDDDRVTPAFSLARYVQRMADGSFTSRTLCDVCFSPIVMPRARLVGAPEPPAVRYVIETNA